MTIPQSQNLLEIHAEHSDPAMWATMMLTKSMEGVTTVDEAHKAVESVLKKALSNMMTNKVALLRTLLCDRLFAKFRNRENWTIREVIGEMTDEMNLFLRDHA